MDSKKVVLVTGGAGFIGSHTNALLNALGYHTLVLDNLIYGHKEALKYRLNDDMESKILNLDSKIIESALQNNDKKDSKHSKNIESKKDSKKHKVEISQPLNVGQNIESSKIDSKHSKNIEFKSKEFLHSHSRLDSMSHPCPPIEKLSENDYAKIKKDSKNIESIDFSTLDNLLRFVNNENVVITPPPPVS